VENPLTERTVNGRFAPGVSGNSKGRPRVTADVMMLARHAAPRAIQRVIELIGSDDERVALAASIAILDRAHGKPALRPQSHTAVDEATKERLDRQLSEARSEAWRQMSEFREMNHGVSPRVVDAEFAPPDHSEHPEGAGGQEAKRQAS
jgi:hypothetical protein